jgi:hypothetical protein
MKDIMQLNIAINKINLKKLIRIYKKRISNYFKVLREDSASPKLLAPSSSIEFSL